MRLAVGVLICLTAGAVSPALADPAATPAAPVTAAPAAAATAPVAAPATPPAGAPAASPATAASKPALDPDEKRLISQGYKPEMRNGVKLYCRREEVLGSRLGQAKHCGTVEQLKVSEQESKDVTEKIQRTQKNPSGG